MKERLNRGDLKKIFKDTRVDNATAEALHHGLGLDKDKMIDMKKKLIVKLINKTKRGRIDTYERLKFGAENIKKIEKLILTVARMKKIGLSKAEKRRNIKESRASAQSGRVMGVAGGNLATFKEDSMKNATKQMLKF